MCLSVSSVVFSTDATFVPAATSVVAATASAFVAIPVILASPATVSPLPSTYVIVTLPSSPTAYVVGAICFSLSLKYPTFTTELSLFPTSVTDMLFAAILLVAITLVTFKSFFNDNPLSSTVKLFSPSFNFTDILFLSFSSIVIPLPALYVSPPPIAYVSPLILSSDTLLFSSLVASTLEPASTVNPSVFSALENLILTSLSTPLPPVPPSLITVIAPGSVLLFSYELVSEL